MALARQSIESIRHPLMTRIRSIPRVDIDIDDAMGGWI
jgi:hypothetical protein